jgi:uncharacterized membrane protein YciS (DUF1049 family)
LSSLDGTTIATLFSAGLSVAAAVFGAKYLKAKALVSRIVEALEDDEISDEELAAIIAEARALVGKSTVEA